MTLSLPQAPMGMLLGGESERKFEKSDAGFCGPDGLVPAIL